MLRSAGPTRVMSRPSSIRLPPLGSSSPAMMFISVLLPQPEGPTSTRNSPSCMPIEMSCRILTGPKLFWTFERFRDAMRNAPWNLRGLSALDGPGHQAAHEVLAGNEVDDECRQRGDE